MDRDEPARARRHIVSPHLSGSELVLSATDLSHFLSCRHATALDLAVANGDRRRPFVADPLLELLWKRGLEHEAAYVARLRENTGDVEGFTHLISSDARVDATIDAMRHGTRVIVQGALRDGRWFGRPDILLRADSSSALGPWSYEVSDTKLARETKAGTMLQLGLYSAMVALVQGTEPERFHVVTPDPATHAPRVESHRVSDYAAYVRWVRDAMSADIARGADALAAANYPEPVERCEICLWASDCRAKRRTDDHLSLVAGITRAQRRELDARAVGTMTALATLPLPLDFKPKRGSAESYVRVREQARLQHESRDASPPRHELLEIEAGKGLCRLPEPTPGDLFLDLEGDPFAADGNGREYLFGLVNATGEYRSTWALTADSERRPFESMMDAIGDAIRAHPEMHVFHYAPYEPSAFKRLMGRYATRDRELDAMLRAGRFVDLYAVVRQGMRAGIERYSIKNLEPLYGFSRAASLPDANRALRAMELALGMNRIDDIPDEVRSIVEAYNRDDCVSTLRLRDWLEETRAAAIASGREVPRSTLSLDEPSPRVDERSRRTDELRTRLLDGIPSERVDRTPAQQQRWLAAYLLDYHRRDDKATWWEYFRLRELPEDELYDERQAVAGVRFVERVRQAIGKKGKPTRSVVDRYAFPWQEMEIERGADVWLQDGKRFGAVVDVDRSRNTIDVEKGPSRADVHPMALFAFSHVSSDVMEDALHRLGDAIAAGTPEFGAARSLLAASPPCLRSAEFGLTNGVSAADYAVRIATDLSDTVLAIQGPPGAGKTRCGARMILALVSIGARVGVTANSHKVIQTLLIAVERVARETGQTVRLAHKRDEDQSDPAAGDTAGIASLSSNTEALEAVRSTDVDVVGGTSWLWARPEMAASVDALFVDEAGQLSLANALAVSQAARSLVLLGDPQQLEQPRKGSHPPGVDVSALEQMLGDHQTIPSDRGLFLGET